MNDRAKELGLKNTNFVNTTGLTADNHYSSANDMVLIARELVKHEKILEFTGTYEDYLKEIVNKKRESTIPIISLDNGLTTTGLEV